MAFSLSPAVSVRELDLSQNVPNIASAKTGMVLRTDQGPALKITSVSNENELVFLFGKPTAANYQDWFQAWNFLQYASSLYIVRPIDANKLTKNAGVTLTSNLATQTSEANLYNTNIAEQTFESLVVADKFAVYNRDITSNQKLSIAVCSSAANFKQPIGQEFIATVASSGASGATVTNNSLVIGSNVLLAGNKVVTITSSSATAVEFDQTVTSTDFVGVTQLVGINFLSDIYDDSAVVKTKIATSTGATLVTEKLISFDRLVEFEPDWAKDEFIFITLQKNSYEKYEIVDRKTVSYRTNGRDVSGKNIFVDDVFFNQSKYVYVKSGSLEFAVDKVETKDLAPVRILGDSASATIYPYNDGKYDGSSYTIGDIQEAAELFADPESFDINLLITHQLDMNGMATIAESRKDCVAIVAPYDYTYIVSNGNSQATTKLLEEFGTQTEGDKVFSAFGTYSAIYGNVKYQYDKFNDINRWICVAGDIAGLYAQTDANRDPWWAPAGSERGVLKNVIKLAFNPNKQNKDDLYVNAINPVVSVAGEGNGVVYGQKTATSKSSAMDRVNVRRLLIYLEKAIASAARAGLFEFNDPFTRSRLFGMIEPFLRTVKSRRGLYDYKVVIDQTNNTNEVIDANALAIDVYLQPAKVAEFIQVSAIVTRTGVDFNEVIGSM